MKRIIGCMRTLRKRPSTERNEIMNEEGMALLTVMVGGGILGALLLTAPLMLNGTTQAGRHNVNKANLLDEKIQMRAYLKYPDSCKKILNDLVHLEKAKPLESAVDQVFSKETVASAVQKNASLKKEAPAKSWIAQGPMQVILGDPIFDGSRIYRATLRIVKLVPAHTPGLTPEDIALYITFGKDGKVNFCESTSISQRDQLTLQDRTCRLTNPEVPSILYDPLTHICRDPHRQSVLTSAGT